MDYIKACRCAAISIVLSVASASALAQDITATREAAADRYLRAVPMSKMLDGTLTEMSKQLPTEQRVQFMGDMKKIVRADYLERLCRQSMIKTFTTDELNALADFYGSKQGAAPCSNSAPTWGRSCQRSRLRFNVVSKSDKNRHLGNSENRGARSSPAWPAA